MQQEGVVHVVQAPAAVLVKEVLRIYQVASQVVCIGTIARAAQVSMQASHWLLCLVHRHALVVPALTCSCCMTCALLLLQINHPLDCPICDQGGECDLQDQVSPAAAGTGSSSSNASSSYTISTIARSASHCTERHCNPFIGCRSSSKRAWRHYKEQLPAASQSIQLLVLLQSAASQSCRTSPHAHAVDIAGACKACTPF
jgi:hypothetical protein